MSKKPAATRRAAPIGAGGATPPLVAGDDLEALRESRRMLTGLLGNLPGMVYRCRSDERWTMEFVSDGCTALTGYAPSDFIGNPGRAYADIIHPDDRERIRTEVRAALDAGCAYCLEYRIHTRGGEVRWVWERGQAVQDGNGALLGLEGFVTDISGRVHAEARLRDSEVAYRALLDVSSHWYWELDAHYRFTRFQGRSWSATRPCSIRCSAGRPGGRACRTKVAAALTATRSRRTCRCAT